MSQARSARAPWFRFAFLTSLVAALPGAAHAGCLPDSIPDNGYLGIGDPGLDGFGADAGMLCCDEERLATVPGTILDVNLSAALTHSFVGDLVIKVRSPELTISTVMSRPGFAETWDGPAETSPEDSNWSGSTILFDKQSNGPSAETMGADLTNDQSICIDGAPGVCAHTPNPGAAQGVMLDDDFDGQSPVGIWTVCIGDAVGEDGGTWDSYVLAVTLDREIPCVCDGKFRGGDRVKYQPGAAPTSDAHPEGSPPALGTSGEVMCGAMINAGYVLVSWDGYAGGNAGGDLCDCPTGALPVGTLSGYYVPCDALALDLPWSDGFESGNLAHWSEAVPPES